MTAPRESNTRRRAQRGGEGPPDTDTMLIRSRLPARLANLSTAVVVGNPRCAVTARFLLLSNQTSYRAPSAKHPNSRCQPSLTTQTHDRNGANSAVSIRLPLFAGSDSHTDVAAPGVLQQQVRGDLAWLHFVGLWSSRLTIASAAEPSSSLLSLRRRRTRQGAPTADDC